MSIIDPGNADHRPGRGPRGASSTGVPVVRRHGLDRTTDCQCARRQPARYRRALEATMAGTEAAVRQQRTTFAVAGAELGATLDTEYACRIARPVSCPRAWQCTPIAKPWCSHTGISGVDGGIEVRAVLASRSTHVLSRMGGWQRRALMQGDRLAIGRAGPAPGRRRRPGSKRSTCAAAVPACA
jgi:antagonist of KipI